MNTYYILAFDPSRMTDFVVGKEKARTPEQALKNHLDDLGFEPDEHTLSNYRAVLCTATTF